MYLIDEITVKRNFPHFLDTPEGGSLKPHFENHCCNIQLQKKEQFNLCPLDTLEMSGIHEIAVNYTSAQFWNESHDKSRDEGETD